MAYTSSDYQLADGLVTELAAALPAYTVSLVGDPREDRRSLTELGIRVRPAAWTQEPATRAYDRDERQVHIGIVGPCKANNLTTLDVCLALCDAVRALWGQSGALRNKTIEGHDPVGALSQSPIYDEASLLENHLFVGTITVTYHRGPSS
jgi:hypothetical protein